MSTRSLRSPKRTSRNRRFAPHAKDDRGSAGIETPIAVSVMFLLVFFVAGGARIITQHGEVASAARAGARSAAAARTSAEANQRATTAATDALDKSACSGPPSVAVSGWEPGGAVTVSVSCVSNMSGVRLLFRDKVVTATAVEYVDALRGEDE